MKERKPYIVEFIEGYVENVRAAKIKGFSWGFEFENTEGLTQFGIIKEPNKERYFLNVSLLLKKGIIQTFFGLAPRNDEEADVLFKLLEIKLTV